MVNFVPIFEADYPRDQCILWASHYEEHQKDEVARLLDEWNNVEIIRSFFKENEKLLKTDFWCHMSVNEAVLKTLQEATAFDKLLKQVEKSGKGNYKDIVHDVFVNLNENEYRINRRGLLELKAKPKGGDTFLRLYGVELEEGQIVISGGGIKLTHKMKHTPKLDHELVKIQKVKGQLKDDGIIFLE